jgi:hypothetical protein
MLRVRKCDSYQGIALEVAEKVGLHAAQPAAAKKIAEKLGFRRTAPKGASQFKELTASLKRCPDTKLEFFSNL